MKSGSIGKRTFIFFTVILHILLGAGNLPAQSAEIVDTILESETLTFGAASYLVLRSAGEKDGIDFAAAAGRISALHPDFTAKKTDDPVTLGEYCFMLMQIHRHPGGLFYKLFPGPRYAFRDLAFEGVIETRANPNARLSGERALQIAGRYLSLFPPAQETGAGG